MKVSVVIACLNRVDTLPAQLQALTEQDWVKPWEIIVADNGSTDGSQAVVECYQKVFPSLRLVDASERRGAAHARNVGARAARGEALAFCDSDDMVAPGYVAAMGEALARYDFVACRYEATKLNPPELVSARRCPQQDGVQQYDDPPYLPHASGGSLGVKRLLHEKVGGFDESLLLLEDTDYCWRIQLSGTKLHFVPKALIHYRYRSTLGEMYHQARGYAEYNVLLYKKYQPLGMPRLSRRTGLEAWIRLLQRTPRLIRTKSGQARLAWEWGWQLGRLQGSLKHHIFAL